MPKGDKLKAAFLPKSRLKAQLAQRVQAARADMQTGLRALTTLPNGDAVRTQLALDAVALRDAILRQETDGADAPGPAFVAMRDVCEDATAFAVTVPQQVQAQQALLDTAAGSAFDQDALQISRLLEDARKARALVSNATAAGGIGQRLARLSGTLGTLAATAKAAPQDIQAHRDQVAQLRVDATTLLTDARNAQTLPPEAGTPRAATRQMLDAVTAIGPLGAKFTAAQRDRRGRTVAEDAAIRLEAFDTHFAVDEAKDPKGAAKNKAMRLATALGAVADRTAKDINDPHLEGRIGQSLAREYGPDLAAGPNGGIDKATAEAVKIAQALLMDDPVGKLLNGKLRPEDAVQRIRDQATIAGLKPSEIMTLLCQQLQMKLGTLNSTEAYAAILSPDVAATSGEQQAFFLANLQGETEYNQFVGSNGKAPLMEFATRTRRGLGDEKLTAQWGRNGPAMSATATRTHQAAPGETLRGLAARFLGDEDRAAEIFEDNKDALNALLAQTPPGQEPDLSGLQLQVKSTPLAELSYLVEQWDTNVPALPDALKAKAPRSAKPPSLPTAPEDPATPAAPLTAEALRQAAQALKSPGETERDGPGYIPAPGLGQDHTVWAAQDGAGAETGAVSTVRPIPPPPAPPVEGPPVSNGALNARQYAHLRLLQRGDAEDATEITARDGKSPEQTVIDHAVQTYGVDAGRAKQMVADVARWFGRVPLTITFDAARLFSDPTKAAPAHGAQYKSEVEYSRTQTSMKDLIGRDDNTRVQDAPKALDGKGQSADKDDPAERPEKVGVTGGDRGAWMQDRGANYMRWRRDKDAREGRLDELAYEDQQIFGAVNPNFESQQGTAPGATNPAHGRNYYGDAHFLLSDNVRSRSAFAVRGGGISVGGSKGAVQRTDIIMLLYDMVKGGPKNQNYLNAMMLKAGGRPEELMTGLDWEVHIYGGFDIRADATEMWLSPQLDQALKDRIEEFAAKHGVACKYYSGPPNGLQVIGPKDIGSIFA